MFRWMTLRSCLRSELNHCLQFRFEFGHIDLDIDKRTYKVEVLFDTEGTKEHRTKSLE